MNIPLADITLPLWLVVSQWTLLFALGFLVLTMYRQLGFLLGLKDLGTEQDGLSTGEKAPTFDYTLVNGSPTTRARFESEGSWSFLVFADPGCVSCQDTLLLLERLAPRLEQKMRVLILTSATSAQIAVSDAFRSATLSIGRIDADVSNKLYHTRTTPFAYLVDTEGVIQSKGIANSESAILKIAQRVDRDVIRVQSPSTRQKARA